MVRARHDAGEADLALYAALDANKPAALVPEGAPLEVREATEDGKWLRVRWRPPTEIAAVDGWVLRTNVDARGVEAPAGGIPSPVAAAMDSRSAVTSTVSEVEFSEADGKLGMELEWFDLGGDKHLVLARVQEGSAAERKGLREGLYLHRINKTTTQELGDRAEQHLAHMRPLKLSFGTRPHERRRRRTSSYRAAISHPTAQAELSNYRAAARRSPPPFRDETVVPEPQTYRGASASGGGGILSQLLSLATCAVTGTNNPQTWGEEVVSRWTGDPHDEDERHDLRPIRGATSAQIARAGIPNDRMPEATGRLQARHSGDGWSDLLSCGNTGSPEIRLDAVEFEALQGQPRTATETRWGDASTRYDPEPDTAASGRQEFQEEGAGASQWLNRHEGMSGGLGDCTDGGLHEEREAVEQQYAEGMQRERRRQEELQAAVAQQQSQQQRQSQQQQPMHQQLSQQGRTVTPPLQQLQQQPTPLLQNQSQRQQPAPLTAHAEAAPQQPQQQKSSPPQRKRRQPPPQQTQPLNPPLPPQRRVPEPEPEPEPEPARQPREPPPLPPLQEESAGYSVQSTSRTSGGRTGGSGRHRQALLEQHGAPSRRGSVASREMAGNDSQVRMAHAGI